MPGPSLRRSVVLLGLLTVLGGFVGIVQTYSADSASSTTGTVASDRRELERYQPSPEELRSPYQRPRPGQARGGVYKDQITPHWFHNDTRFWYRNNLRGGAKEFILVDAEAGTRRPAFDHQRLAAALSKGAGAEYRADRLPFDEIAFVNEGKTVSFRVGGTVWKCDLTSYECSKEESGATLPQLDEAALVAARVQEQAERERQRQERDLARMEAILPDGPNPSEDQEEQAEQVALLQRPPDRGGRSPDGKWTAFVKENNVYVRSQDGKEIPLSKDGAADNSYGNLEWAGDSKTLVAFRIEPGERKEVYLIQSSPPGGGRAKLQTIPYALPGDKFTAYELNLFDVAGQKQAKPEVDRIDFARPDLRWRQDGHTFTYEKRDRGHQRFRLIEVDTHTGKARNLIDEKTETFIWSAHMDGLNLRAVNWLRRTDEIIQMTERDGWRHLYLLDAKEGKVKNLITPGFPDRILWHQAVAKKYPSDDISRVGIYGTSAGGQNSTGGVLFHPDFYKVAVSGSGCHDNRMDKASWNEQWMGYPVGPQYAESSNVDNARRLRGKLLLIVGELDKNVPPESTLRVADALIRAGKDFDYLVVPNAGHGSGGAYGARRMQDFFVRHLHGVEPPDRNAGARAGGE